MLALFVSSIPLVNVIMVVVWAFTGENESRKNYFKAIIAWFIIGVALCTMLVLIGFFPAVIVAAKELGKALGL